MTFKSNIVCECVYACHFVLTPSDQQITCHECSYKIVCECVYTCHFVLIPSDLLMLCHVSLRLCDTESVVHTCMSLHSSKTGITIIAGNLSPDF